MAIPSIVYGFALVVIVPIIRDVFRNRYECKTASLLIMILPTVISILGAAIRAVPNSYYEGSIG